MSNKDKFVGISAEKLISLGNQSFTDGHLEEALEYFRQAHKSKARNAQMFHVWSQTLQRLNRYKEALDKLDEGMKFARDDEDKILLLNLKAQIHSSQQQWIEATTTYERLLDLQSGKDSRRGHRRFTLLQLANIYIKTGKLDQARGVIKELLEEFPNDQQALRIKTALETAKFQIPTSALEDDTVEVDLPNEPVDLISPMLQRDIEVSSYRDEIILRQGRPTSIDADRLLKEAESSRGADFVERFPLFLEAAKAYSELPELSYDLGNFYRALARYAMLKGGALVSQFDRDLKTKPIQLDKLKRLRDSAISYYLEALLLQVNIGPDYILIALTNYLYVQVAYLYEERKLQIPDHFVDSRKQFAKILTFAARNENEQIRMILCKSIISWGASMGRAWNEASNVKGSVGGLFRVEYRTILYEIFTELTGITFTPDDRLGKVLSKIFKYRRTQIQEAHRFFSRFQTMRFDVETFRKISEQWAGYKSHQDTLLDTDVDAVVGIARVLSILSPYQTRSIEERTSILVSARNIINKTLEFISENTTYWGRVSFEPILLRWQDAIQDIEIKRTSEVLPSLLVSLEPEVFSIEADTIIGTLRLDNTGRGTSEQITLNYQISDYHGVLIENNIQIKEEIRASGKFYIRITFPKNKLTFEINQAYQLHVTIIPFYQGVELESREANFTLEIDTTIGFDLEDIVWDELRIPDKPKLFVGRDEFIQMLASHLKSRNRARTYILVGLTRTGKSSILKYLSQRVDLSWVQVREKNYQLICFIWDLAKASAHTIAADMWEYLLIQQIVDKLRDMVEDGKLSTEAIPVIRPDAKMRLKDWNMIVNHLHQHRLFPVILIDEFSHYKYLVDKQRLDASFLAMLRSNALEDQAAFVFAGTYDLRKLIQDPTYGITGQLVNATQKSVSSVSDEAAIELIQAMGDLLIFTPDARELILHLSGRIPYFIQLLCKRCAEFAYYNKRRYMGPSEVDLVVKFLTGEVSNEYIARLDSSIFMNNMLMVGDPPEFQVTLTTICDIVRKQQFPRYVTYSEIMSIWHEREIPHFKGRLSSSLNELKDREVLLQQDDEGQPCYRISVDLFRRWWTNEHLFLGLALDTLREKA